MDAGKRPFELLRQIIINEMDIPKETVNFSLS